jgi:hypothetical protein
MTAADLAEHIQGAIRDGRGWKAPCSVHRPDTNPSVKWHDDGDRVLLRCHATCRTEAVMAGYGLTMADLFHHPHERRDGAVVIATYDYCDLAGMVRYQTVRLEPKGFYQRRPDGRGGWINNLDGVEPLCYQLPALQGQRVCAGVEGEEDAATLMGLGLVATTNHGGAGKWRECHTEQLVRAGIERVYLFRDNDRAGARHRRQVATSLAAAGLELYAVDLPGLGPLKDKHGEDISDWLRAGHTPEELLALLGPAPRWTPDADRGAEDLGAGADPHDDRRSQGQGPARDRAKPTPWDAAVSAPEYIAAVESDGDFLDPGRRFLARGVISEWFSPRGLGKTNVMLEQVVSLARTGLRVLLIDRDNPRREIKRRLRAMGAGLTPTLKIIDRTKAPPLTDKVAWAAFPVAEYDVVIVGSSRAARSPGSKRCPRPGGRTGRAARGAATSGTATGWPSWRPSSE